MKRHPRESYLLATKCPAWAAKTKEKAQSMLDKSLERTGAGIVGSCGNYDPLMLQSVRLSVVMQMADCISRSISLVEKFWDNTAFV